MPEPDFKTVQVFLVEREGNTRRLLRSILARMGMDRMFEFTTPAEASAALSTTMPDLILVDCDPPDGDGFRFINQLRHSGQATNPFVCAIATTWQPTQPLMVRFTGSGADDLLVKPFSAKQVQDRVMNLMDGRKSFVVTSDYIGPDRRRAPREGIQIPLFDVPNTLRQKALGQFDRTTIGDQIFFALASINEQKVVRHGFQTAFLMEFAAPGLAATPPDRMAMDHVLRIPPVVEDMLRRIPARDETRMQTELYAKVILDALARFKQNPALPLEDLPTVKRAAMGLAALTARRTDLPALEQEVAAAVGAYRNRLDQMAQAKAQASQTSPPAGGDKPADRPADKTGVEKAASGA
ncbi:MAG: hypothetical protein RLY86_3552 [Pseudomonadota bacterium]|jgi:DNA-binding response OmpR family regulator